MILIIIKKRCVFTKETQNKQFYAEIIAAIKHFVSF